MCFGEYLAARSLFEAKFGQALLLKADVFQEDAPETAIFEENGKEKMLRFDGSMPGIMGDFPGLFQTVPGVKRQFLIESRFEHRGGSDKKISLPILGFSSPYCQSCHYVGPVQS